MGKLSLGEALEMRRRRPVAVEVRCTVCRSLVGRLYDTTSTEAVWLARGRSDVASAERQREYEAVRAEHPWDGAGADPTDTPFREIAPATWFTTVEMDGGPGTIHAYCSHHRQLRVQLDELRHAYRVYRATSRMQQALASGDHP